MTARTQEHGEPILSARGIVNRFGKQVVHDKLSLDIRQGEIIGIDHFGASAPAKDLFKAYGFTPEHVVEAIEKVLAK